jgi:hypothetical protein
MILVLPAWKVSITPQQIIIKVIIKIIIKIIMKNDYENDFRI